MPRTYAHNRTRGTSRRANAAPFQAVAQSQRQAANPYRMHTGDPLVSGVSNLAAALFRAPVERSQIEDQRAARQQMLQHQNDRENKDDLFRNKQLETQHQDAQARIASKAAGAKPAGQTGAPKMGTIPAFVRQSTVDPVTNKTTYTQRPLNDGEMASALKNQQRVQAVGALGAGTNPDNGKPLGAQNPYHVPLTSPAQQMAEQDALFGGQHGAPSPAKAAPVAAGSPSAPVVAAPAGPVGGMPGAAPAAAPVGGVPAAAVAAPAAAAPVGGMPAANPHAVIDPGQFPPGMLDALYPGGPQQAQAASQKVSALHPDDQKQYGQLLGAVVQAHQAGDAQAVAETSAKLQVANQRLGIGAPAAAPAAQTGLSLPPAQPPVGGLPASAAPAPAPAISDIPAAVYGGI